MHTSQSHPFARLQLIPISHAALLAELAGDGSLGSILGAEITHQWPPTDWEPHVLNLLLDSIARDGASAEFHRYILLRRDGASPVLIGTVNAFVWPERPAEVEFGYCILPAFQRHGYATEAARMHLDWLRRLDRRYEVVAQTFPDLTASIRILEGLGFGRDGAGREPGAIAFRLPS